MKNFIDRNIHHIFIFIVAAIIIVVTAAIIIIIILNSFIKSIDIAIKLTIM